MPRIRRITRDSSRPQRRQPLARGLNGFFLPQRIHPESTHSMGVLPHLIPTHISRIAPEAHGYSMTHPDTVATPRHVSFAQHQSPLQPSGYLERPTRNHTVVPTPNENSKKAVTGKRPTDHDPDRPCPTTRKTANQIPTGSTSHYPRPSFWLVAVWALQSIPWPPTAINPDTSNLPCNIPLPSP